MFRYSLLFPGEAITFRMLTRKGRTFKTLLARSSKRKEPVPKDYKFKYDELAKSYGERKLSNGPTTVTFTVGDLVLALELVEGKLETV